MMIGEIGQYPCSRAAAAADDGREFHNGFVRKLAAADTLRLQHAEQAGRMQIVQRFIGDAAQFLRAQCALAQHGHESVSACFERVVSGRRGHMTVRIRR